MIVTDRILGGSVPTAAIASPSKAPVCPGPNHPLDGRMSSSWQLRAFCAALGVCCGFALVKTGAAQTTQSIDRAQMARDQTLTPAGAAPPAGEGELVMV